MAWSPDQEVVVFATGLDKLILMNKEFDPIMETALHTTEAGEGTSNVTITFMLSTEAVLLPIMQIQCIEFCFHLLQQSRLLLGGVKRKPSFMDLLGRKQGTKWQR